MVRKKDANNEKTTLWCVQKEHICKKKHGKVRIPYQNNMYVTDACVLCLPKGDKNDKPARKKDANMEKATCWCVQKEHIGKKTNGRVRIPCQNNNFFPDACVLC